MKTKEMIGFVWSLLFFHRRRWLRIAGGAGLTGLIVAHGRALDYVVE